MPSVNAISVLTMLLALYDPSYKVSIPLNSAELKLYETLYDVISRCMDDNTFVIEEDTYLDIDKPCENDDRIVNTFWLHDEPN